MSDECQMRNLHAARARVIIHFKEGRKRKRERRAGAGVSDDVRFAFCGGREEAEALTEEVRS